jgi:hypothetical protein
MSNTKYISHCATSQWDWHVTVAVFMHWCSVIRHDPDYCTQYNFDAPCPAILTVAIWRVPSLYLPHISAACSSVFSVSVWLIRICLQHCSYVEFMVGSEVWGVCMHCTCGVITYKVIDIIVSQTVAVYCSNFLDSSVNPCITFYYHSLLLLEFNFVMLFLCMGIMWEKEKCNQFSLHVKKNSNRNWQGD